MACKKSELITAIDSYAAARSTNDQTLLNFSGSLVNQFLATLEFEPEDEILEEEKSQITDKKATTAKLKRPKRPAKV